MAMTNNTVPAENRKVRAALVGAGYVSRYHVRALKSLPFVEIVGICDADPAKAEKIAREFGIPAVRRTLAELAALHPEVIHILTPPPSHCELTLEALRMGCHVFVEKPMAQTEDECVRMIAAAEERGRVLSVNHSARLDPVVLRALEMVRHGVCGDVLSVDFLRSSDYPPYAGGAVPIHYASGGYPFQDIGVHGLYLLESFLGEIRNVDARYLSTGRNPLLTFDEWQTIVECGRGIGRMYLSWNVQPMQNEIIIYGTRGVIRVDCYLQTCTVRRRIPAPKSVQRLYAAVANSLTTIGSVTANALRMATGRLRPSPGIHAGVRGFHLALRNGKAVPVPAGEGRRIVAWAETAIQGASEAKRQIVQTLATPPAPARVLVTGASGFLGSALVARLIREGESPRVLLRRPSSSLQATPGVKIVYGDLGNPEDVDRAVAGVDVVYHAGAAMMGCAADFECATVWGTRNVIDACLKHGVKKLVHVSSLSVLDHASHARGETMNESSSLEPNPEWRGHYTRSKLVAEQLVAAAVRERGLRAVIVRPGMIFGPGARLAAPSGTVGVGRRWVVMGSGKLVLPLIYVDDVADALLLAAKEVNATGGIFHLTDESAVTQREYINLCCRQAGGGLRALYVPRAVFYGAAVAVEILGHLLGRSAPLTRYKVRSLPPLSSFDTTRARECLRWTPSVGVPEGLRRTFMDAAPFAPSRKATVSTSPAA